MTLFRRLLPALMLLASLAVPIQTHAAAYTPPAPQVTGIGAVHQAGQTFVTFQEIETAMPAEAPTGKEFFGILRATPQTVRYNIYSAPHPILTVEGLTPKASVAPFPAGTAMPTASTPTPPIRPSIASSSLPAARPWPTAPGCGSTTPTPPDRPIMRSPW